VGPADLVQLSLTGLSEETPGDADSAVQWPPIARKTTIEPSRMTAAILFVSAMSESARNSHAQHICD